MTLDLHGVRHAEAEKLVEETVLLNEPPYRFITGQSLEMQKIVVKVLEKHKLEYSTIFSGQVIAQ
jgi:hypothetical protein